MEGFFNQAQKDVGGAIMKFSLKGKQEVPQS